ncbi:hypothetical protein L6164_010835 [Bauhinia variegata]|uniref:Uncharacterized protein n=1 Tax=Bauhinia variegata TaxID=167791 RepID=A0ACB9P6K5_BAUVA|nr:hypothetical protein L6164_010835 [Bauhinia variegata]
MRAWLGFIRRSFYSEPGKRFAVLWGNGDYRRSGLGSFDSHWRPVVCSSAFQNQSLKAIACGGAHTLLSDNGRVYATGLNDFGQLAEQTLPNVDGEFYMSEKNTSGQLGLGKSSAKLVPLPTKLECLDGLKIEMASLGSEYSAALIGILWLEAYNSNFWVTEAMWTI